MKKPIFLLNLQEAVEILPFGERERERVITTSKAEKQLTISLVTIRLRERRYRGVRIEGGTLGRGPTSG